MTQIDLQAYLKITHKESQINMGLMNELIHRKFRIFMSIIFNSLLSIYQYEIYELH